MSQWDTMETGIFYSRSSADQAATHLSELGYKLDDINLLMSEKTRAEEFADVAAKKATEGALAGAIIGGSLSAVVASLVATGSIVTIAATGGAATPLVAGPLAAALAALGAGAGAGGILGALIAAGVTEGQAKHYEEALKKGAIIIGIHPRNQDRERVKAILASDESNTSDYAETTNVSGTRR
jgi:hypothetical protein